MAFTKAQDAAMTDILCDWHHLSRGDVSIICAVQREPGDVMTSAGTPHGRFWTNPVRIGWAEKLYSPIDPETVPVESLSFRLTPEGDTYLPRFLIFYDLLNMGACAPAADRMAAATVAEPAPTPIPSSSSPLRPVPALFTVFLAVTLAAKGVNPASCFFLLTVPNLFT